MAKLPADAFTFYAGLGPGRSYQAVADHYGVVKRSVTRHAAKDNWQARLAAIERTAREKGDAQQAESMQEVQARHLKVAKLLQGKALEALRATHLGAGSSAIRALESSVKLERLLLGQTGADEPTDDTYVMRLTQPDIDELLALGKECRERREASLRAEIERSVRAQIKREQEAVQPRAAGELLDN